MSEKRKPSLFTPDGALPPVVPFDWAGDIEPLMPLLPYFKRLPLSNDEARLAVRAAYEVLRANPTGLPPGPTEMFLSHFTQPFADDRPADPEVVKLLELASTQGFPVAAYNAANLVAWSMRTRKDFDRAVRHYQRAVKLATDFDLKACELVNYGMLVRDGPPGGSPDWEGAVELFAQAARAGKLVAMNNAAIVSGWIATRKHGREHGGDHSQAAYWCQFALDWIKDGKPTLIYDSDIPEPQMVSQIKAQLAQDRKSVV